MNSKPVAILTLVVAVLTALDGALTGTGVLSPTVAGYLGGAIAIGTAILGYITHGKVTPVARPRDNSDRPLVPLTHPGAEK